MRIVGGKYRGKKLSAPLHTGTRPTSDRTRETIFNILLHNPAFGPHTVQGKDVLDVFAGTGALGLEAFSRGAKTVTFVENNREALKVLCENLKAFDLPSTVVHAQDGLCFQSPQAFDLVFLDPPYHQNLILPMLNRLFHQKGFSEKAVIVIEMGKEESIPMPECIELVTERLSGAAKILFCCLKNERDLL